jgi:hypothetical protein
MRKSILLWPAIISIFLLVSISISSASEIKSLEDFKNSTFIKKYRQKGQMTSTQLKTEISAEARGYIDEKLVREVGRGYSYGFFFYLGGPPAYDEYDFFSIGIVTKSKDNPIIYYIHIEFHDESIPPSSGPTKFNKHIRDIFEDLINSIDSTLPLKDVADYVQKQSIIKYKQMSDSPKKTFGRYSFRVGTLSHDLFVRIDKSLDTGKRR